MTTMQICSLLWTFLLVVWAIAWLRTKRNQERAPFGSRLSYGVPVVLASWLLFSENFPFPWLQDRIIPKNIYTETAAITVTALGIALAIWARFYLGQNWSSAPTVKIGHELIRTGPYAWVRHPIYSGLILAAIGTAIARGEPRGFLSVALFWLAFSIKVRLEEKFMRKTFGPEYEDYSKSTGALIPRLRM